MTIASLFGVFCHILTKALKCCHLLMTVPRWMLLSIQLLRKSRRQRIPVSARHSRHYYLRRKARRRTRALPSRRCFASCQWEGGWSPPSASRCVSEPHDNLHVPKATYGRWYKRLTSDPSFDPLRQFRHLRLLQGPSPFLKKVPDPFREPQTFQWCPYCRA
jgi:hypothetical protein